VLLIRGGDGRDWLEQRLIESGMEVETVAAYSRGRPAWSAGDEAAASSAASGAWLFSSSEAIANLRSLVPQHDWGGARAIATHPRIAEAARDAGFGVVCESRPALDDVARTLESLG
jgi:uroporphyrinogen-III synthase